MGLRRTGAAVIAAAFLAFAVPGALSARAADVVTEKSLDELKAEVLRRASEKPPRSMMAGMKLDDVREALSHITTLNRDEWARAWIALGDRYMEWGENRARAGDVDIAKQQLLLAYRYYKLGHYPVDNSPEKRRAYEKGINAFLVYARYLDPPLEVVDIPFEGESIVGYLRLPKANKAVPVVYFVSALDSRKEEWIERNEDYLSHGIGVFVTDMPGTGQAPILADEHADRMFSRVLDWFATRPEIDSKRIGFYGGSWSGYWAVKMAIVERARLRAVAAQGPGVHYYFQRDWQKTAVETPDYLMDLFPARTSVYGVSTMEQFLSFGPRMSLKTQGLLGKPAAPILLVNGARDTQVPIKDLYLAFGTMDAVKEAWVNPEGGHMGRGKDWSSRRIRSEVVAPWMIRHLTEPDQISDAAEAN
jgi:pimeloyl-ACP methyl ester carboxylesterase